MTALLWRRVLPLGLLALAMLVLNGCATKPVPPKSNEQKTVSERIDPWENWNRKVYAFNDTIDEAVLKPVATTYTKVIPQPVRRGVSNVFGNVSDVWSAFNNFLQGKVADGLQDVMRVGTNTVFGIGGAFDVASEFGADRQSEDFGQTLGYWGMPSGPYVVWPLFGPSTVRESLALPLDRSVSPALAVHDTGAKYAIVGLQAVSERASLLGASGLLDDIALDKYTFVRDAYLQRRRSLIYDGNAPEPKDTENDLPSGNTPNAAPRAADAPASQPTR